MANAGSIPLREMGGSQYECCGPVVSDLEHAGEQWLPYQAAVSLYSSGNSSFL